MTSYDMLPQFFAYDECFHGFQDLCTTCSGSTSVSSKAKQAPAASIGPLSLDASAESPGSASSPRSSWSNSDAASYEDEHELSETIDSKLSPEWDEHNEKVRRTLKAWSLWVLTEWQIIKQPYNYLASMPGKGVRTQVINAFNDWYHVDENSCEIIAETITMMHNASLLIDDIQDNTKFRRGHPSAHEVFGIAQTINSANYVYFEAQQHLLNLPDWPKAMKTFNEEMMNLHRGQGMELYWRDTNQPPSEAGYLQMISNKTGGLFRLILRLLQAMSSVEIDASELVDVIGLMFQVLDDLKNVCDEKMAAQKGFFDDLTEGKFSYPIAHVVWTGSPEKDRVLELLRMRTEDNVLKADAAKCLERAGSLAHTRQVIASLDKRARLLLDKIGVPNPGLVAILDKLVDGLHDSMEPLKLR